MLLRGWTRNTKVKSSKPIKSVIFSGYFHRDEYLNEIEVLASNITHKWKSNAV